MSIRRTIRLTYDRTHRIVHIRMYRRRWDGERRRKVEVAALPIGRDRLRQLCDQLHDYADQLDREDREAATRPTDATNAPRGSVVPERDHSTAHDTTARRTQPTTREGRSDREKPDPQTKAPAVICPSPAGVPHRAHARTRGAAGRG